MQCECIIQVIPFQILQKILNKIKIYKLSIGIVRLIQLFRSLVENWLIVGLPGHLYLLAGIGTFLLKVTASLNPQAW